MLAVNLESNALAEVEHWVYKDIFSESNEACMHILSRYLGISLGLASSLFNYIYASNFGEYRLGIGKLGGMFLGYVAVTPLAALGWVSNETVFGALANRKSAALKNISRKKSNISCIKQIARISMLALLGSIGATTVIYANHQAFAQYHVWPMVVLAYLTDVPVAISKVVLYGWAIDMFYKKILSQAHTLFARPIINRFKNSMAFKHIALESNLKQVIDVIKKLNSEEVDPLFDTLHDGAIVLEKNANPFFHLDKIFTLAQNYKNEAVSPLKKKLHCANTVSKNIVGLLGAVIGLTACYLIVSLGKKAMQTILGISTLDVDTINTYSEIFGWTSALCIGPLMIKVVRESIEKFYNACVALPGVLYPLSQSLKSIPDSTQTTKTQASRVHWHSVARKAFTVFSVMLSCISSVPRIELTINNVVVHPLFDRIILIAVFIGVFSQDFWALENFFNGILLKPDNRQKLIDKVQRIAQCLPKMTDVHIIAQYNRFCADAQSPSIQSKNERLPLLGNTKNVRVFKAIKQGKRKKEGDASQVKKGGFQGSPRYTIF